MRLPDGRKPFTWKCTQKQKSFVDEQEWQDQCAGEPCRGVGTPEPERPTFLGSLSLTRRKRRGGPAVLTSLPLDHQTRLSFAVLFA